MTKKALQKKLLNLAFSASKETSGTRWHQEIGEKEKERENERETDIMIRDGQVGIVRVVYEVLRHRRVTAEC